MVLALSSSTRILSRKVWWPWYFWLAQAAWLPVTFTIVMDHPKHPYTPHGLTNISDFTSGAVSAGAHTQICHGIMLNYLSSPMGAKPLGLHPWNLALCQRESILSCSMFLKATETDLYNAVSHYLITLLTAADNNIFRQLHWIASWAVSQSSFTPPDLRIVITTPFFLRRCSSQPISLAPKLISMHLIMQFPSPILPKYLQLISCLSIADSIQHAALLWAWTQTKWLWCPSPCQMELRLLHPQHSQLHHNIPSTVTIQVS